VYDDGRWAKCLVLDNVEARSEIPQKYWGYILRRLADLGYGHVFCGTLRNDCKFDELSLKGAGTFNRPASMAEYANKFNTGFDDSTRVFPVCGTVEPAGKPRSARKRAEAGVVELARAAAKAWTVRNPAPSKEDLKAILDRTADFISEVDPWREDPGAARLHLMDRGDLVRCSYVEKLVYGRGTDPDFLKIDLRRSPSYVVDSPSTIYGYLCTGLYRCPPGEDPGACIRHGHWKPKRSAEEGCRPVVMIEDVVSRPYPRMAGAWRAALDHLGAWCRAHGVEDAVVAPNENSRALLRHVEAVGLRIHSDRVQSGSPADRPAAPPGWRPRSIEIDLPEVQQPEEIDADGEREGESQAAEQ